MADDPAANTPEFSVSELSGALKRTVEDRFGHVRVRGEVSGYRGPHSSGHVYFSLKDQGARLDAVIWKGVFSRMRVRPEEGLEVVALGKISTFAGKSSYQIIVESLELAGLGALMALLEERRRRLAAEGLFAEARKQLLPPLPSVIGVVTSPTGAVIRDILHRIADRFPMHVVVWPVRVQGETSAAEVAAAIAGFNALDDDGAIPRPDVLIVARGGGSLEDLLGFNDEAVVRAAAASLIPLISAVGHETDWTLIDHAADMRAPTPTAAAELAVPRRSDLMRQSQTLALRANESIGRALERCQAGLRAAARGLPRIESLFGERRQRLDSAGDRLATRFAAAQGARRNRLQHLGALVARHAPSAEVERRRGRLAAAGHALDSAFARVPARLAMALQRSESRLAPAMRRGAERRRERLDAAGQRLDQAFAARLSLGREALARRRETSRGLSARLARALREGQERRAALVAASGQLLASLSYRGVLARGFALIRDEAGAPVRAASSVSPGARLAIEFADGGVAVTAEGGGKPRRTGRTGAQGSLFGPGA